MLLSSSLSCLLSLLYKYFGSFVFLGLLFTCRYTDSDQKKCLRSEDLQKRKERIKMMRMMMMTIRDVPGSRGGSVSDSAHD